MNEYAFEKALHNVSTMNSLAKYYTTESIYNAILNSSPLVWKEEWKAVLYSYLNDHQRYNTMR